MLTAYFLTVQFYQVRMSLAPEWQIRHSKSRGGRVYYFNKLTNETRWDCPVGKQHWRAALQKINLNL